MAALSTDEEATDEEATDEEATDEEATEKQAKSLLVHLLLFSTAYALLIGLGIGVLAGVAFLLGQAIA